jgi:hypothetical protein
MVYPFDSQSNRGRDLFVLPSGRGAHLPGTHFYVLNGLMQGDASLLVAASRLLRNQPGSPVYELLVAGGQPDHRIADYPTHPNHSGGGKSVKN